MDPNLDLHRRYVDTWRQAAVELAEIQQAELIATDTQEAVRQLYGNNRLVQDAPQRDTSGLVEQQRWFSRLAR